jgi:hypothetical protein
MGFFDDIFGPNEVEKKVDSYFVASRTKYDCVRLCMRDLILKPQQTRMIDPAELSKITEALLRHADHLALKYLIQASLLRCAHPFSVNLIHTNNRPIMWVDKGAVITKSERELRFTLYTKGDEAMALISLYDDGSRISPKVPGVDDVAGWKIALQG